MCEDRDTLDKSTESTVSIDKEVFNKTVQDLNEIRNRIIAVANDLHEDDCYNKDNLALGQGCCYANKWSGKTKKVAEALVFCYKVFSNAPHDKDCRAAMRHIWPCTCWKGLSMGTLENFFRKMSE